MSFKVGQKVKIIGHPWKGYFANIIEVIVGDTYPYKALVKNIPDGVVIKTCPYDKEEIELVVAVGEQMEFSFMYEGVV